MSDTPRTDRQAGWAIANTYGTSTSNELYADTKGVFVHAAFARELERENAELKSVLQEIANAAHFENIGNWARNKAREALK